MIELLYARPAQLLAETLFHFLWQGAVLVLLLKLAEPILGSNSKRYLASVSMLVLMLVMPIATYGLLNDSTPGTFTEQPNHIADLATAESVTMAPLSQDIHDILVRAQPVLVGFWIFGVVLLGVRLLVGYAGTVWLRGDCRPLPARLAERATWLRQRLGVTIRCRVYLSERVDEAIAVGYFKPLVIVPLAWASELPASVLEAVIAHELAHIRRCDLWVTLLQRLAETLLFYHPAVWWLSRRLTVERELCCDELAVTATQSRVEYVQALETIARRMRKPSLTLAMSFFGGGNMNLLQRVRNVLTSGSSHEASDWWPAGFVALIAPAIAALALSGWSPLAATALADDDDDKPEVELRERKVLDAKRKAAEIEAVEEQLKVIKRKVAQAREAEDDDEKEEREIKDKQERVRKRSLGEPVKEEVHSLNPKAPPKKNVKSDDDNDFDFSDFRPETAREEKLMAVIKKLQAQLKETKPLDKGPGYKEEAKRHYEIESKKALLDKLNQVDEQKRAALEKELAVRKAREAKDKLPAAEKKPKLAAVEKKPAKPPEDLLKKLVEEKPEIEVFRKKLDAVKEQVVREKEEVEKAGNKADFEKLQQALELKEAQLRKAAEALKKYEQQGLKQKEAPEAKKEIRKPRADKDDDDDKGEKVEKRKEDKDDKDDKPEKDDDADSKDAPK